MDDEGRILDELMSQAANLPDDEESETSKKKKKGPGRPRKHKSPDPPPTPKITKSDKDAEKDEFVRKVAMYNRYWTAFGDRLNKSPLKKQSNPSADKIDILLAEIEDHLKEKKVMKKLRTLMGTVLGLLESASRISSIIPSFEKAPVYYNQCVPEFFDDELLELYVRYPWIVPSTPIIDFAMKLLEFKRLLDSDQRATKVDLDDL